MKLNYNTKRFSAYKLVLEKTSIIRRPKESERQYTCLWGFAVKYITL